MRGPPDRRAEKACAKGVRAEREDLLGVEGRGGPSWLGAPGRVERTDVLTLVAPEEAAFERGLLRRREARPFLDREIRDAFPGVEDARCEESGRGACVEAGRARPAAVRARIGGRGGRGERGVGQDLAEDHVRAEARHDQEPVLAEEAEAGARRDLAFEKRRRVDAHAEMRAPGRERAEILDDGLEVPAHDAVVVLASRELRHVAGPVAGYRARHREDRSRVGQDRVEARAGRGVALEVRHLCVKPLFEPRAVSLERERLRSREHAGGCEAVGARRIDRGPREAGGIVGKRRRRLARSARKGGPHDTSVYQAISYHSSHPMTARARGHAYPLVFFLLLVVGTGILCLVVLRPFLTSITWSVILAVALWPLWLRLRARLPRRTAFAAAVFSICTGLVVLLPAVLLGKAIVNQAATAVTAIGEKLRARELRSLGDLLSVPGVAPALTWIEARTGLSSDEMQSRGAEFAAKASTFLAAKSGDVALSFLDAVVTFVVTLILLFFLLIDGEGLAEAVSDLFPIEDAERHRIVQSLGGMLGAIFKGSLVCAVVQGASGGISWAIAGLPSAILAGVAMGIFSLLPVGGTAIVWLPGLIALFVQGRTEMAIFFLLWNVIVTSLLADNVLKPLLIGRKDTDLSTLMVFLGVFGGIPAFGLLGVFVGPMALAAGLMLVRVLRSLAKEARVSAAA